jgi:hypothetical protein
LDFVVLATSALLRAAMTLSVECSQVKIVTPSEVDRTLFTLPQVVQLLADSVIAPTALILLVAISSSSSGSAEWLVPP